MPTDPNVTTVLDIMGLKHLRRALASPDPVGLAAVLRSMPRDYLLEIHEFNTAIETAHWTAANTGVGVTDFAYNAQRCGALRGATNVTANNVMALYKVQTYFDAADNPFMLVRWKAPAAVTSFQYEIGFSDPKTSEVAVSVTDLSVPTVANGVTDAVFLAYSTAASNPKLVSVGTTDTAAKQNYTDFSLTAGKWQWALVGARNRGAYAAIWDNGALVGRATLASGPDTAIAMRPSLLFKTLNTVTKQIDIDTIILGCERNAS